MKFNSAHLAIWIAFLVFSCTSNSNQSTQESTESSASELVDSDGFDTSLSCFNDLPSEWKLATKMGENLIFKEPCDARNPIIQFVEGEIFTMYYLVGEDGNKFEILGCKKEAKGDQWEYRIKVKDIMWENGAISIFTILTDGATYESTRKGYWSGLEKGNESMLFISETDYGNYKTETEICFFGQVRSESEVIKNPRNIVEIFLTMPKENIMLLSPDQTPESFKTRRDLLNGSSNSVVKIDTISNFLSVERNIDGLTSSLTMTTFEDKNGIKTTGIGYYAEGGSCDRFYLKFMRFENGSWIETTKTAFPTVSLFDFLEGGQLKPEEKFNRFNLKAQFSGNNQPLSVQLFGLCEMDATDAISGDINSYYSQINELPYNTLKMAWNSDLGKFEITEKLRK